MREGPMIIPLNPVYIRRDIEELSNCLTEEVKMDDVTR